MTYQNKSSFIDGLKDALSRYDVSEQREILLDFEQHFSDGAAAGETEAQVCEKLGDPEEIAKQYASDGELSLGETAKKEPPSETAPPEPPPAEETPRSDGFGAPGESVAAENAIDRLFGAGEEARAYFGGDGLRRVEVRIAGANARIAAADTYAAEVTYRAGRSNVRFTARVENGTLFVRESPEFTATPAIKASELTVTLPRREYESLAVTLAAGSVRTELLTGIRFTGEVMSGNAVFGAFADKMDVTVRSGQMELNNCGVNRAARRLRIDCFSGRSAVRGFFTERYELEQKSGKLTVEGLSGTGAIRVKSGVAQIGYAEWNGDLSADVTSGNVKLLLPDGSGAYLNADVTSGNITVALNNETAAFGRGKCNVRIGGANLHTLNAGITSGAVRIENGGASAANPAPPFVQGAPLPPPVITEKKAPDAGKIIGILFLDLLLFSWALPTLATFVTVIFAGAVSIGISGGVSMVGGAAMGVTDVSGWFSSGFSPVSTVLLGALMADGAVLLFLLAMKAATGFINVILRIVNLHSRAIVGRNVCALIGKKYRNNGFSGKV